MSENNPTTDIVTPKVIYKDWLLEMTDPLYCPGESFGMKISKEGGVLKEVQSPYQHILVVKTETYGNVMLLDGVVNCTERDECSYQEMMTHLALCSHPDPKNVLIIGGGDGGVAREAAKHKRVQRIDQCEIDGEVVEVCKEFFPKMACGFENPKVNLIIGDGFEFMKGQNNKYDVIITDSSDPEEGNIALSLFSKEYYRMLFNALKEDGILISQAESLWVVAKELADTMRMVTQVFPVVDYAHTLIPSYTTSLSGFLLASKNTKTNFKEPTIILNKEEMEEMELKYYNQHIHRSSFVFPRFMQRIIQDSIHPK